MQAACNPGNVVPGISFSPDKMLRGRLVSYGDAQRYRLGVNHRQIPVNKARCPVHGFSHDGAMRGDGNYGSTLPYEPNSYGEWQEQPEKQRVLCENTGRNLRRVTKDVQIRHIKNCFKGDPATFQDSRSSRRRRNSSRSISPRA